MDIISVALESGGFTDEELVHQMMTFLVVSPFLDLLLRPDGLPFPFNFLQLYPDHYPGRSRDNSEGSSTSLTGARGGSSQIYLGRAQGSTLNAHPSQKIVVESAE